MTAPAASDIDVRLIAALQRDGRATVSELSRVLELPRGAVSNRLRGLLTDGVVRVVAAVDPSFLGQHVLAHVSVVVSGPVASVFQEVRDFPEAVLVSAVNGPHGLIAEIRVGTHDELHEVLARIRRHPHVAQIDTLIYADVIKGLFISHEVGTATIDDIDTSLIELLQRDGRASYRELARAVNLSATAVGERVQRLLDRRIIQISAVESRGARGRRLSMGVGMNLSGDGDSVIRLLHDSPHVEFAAQTVGRFDAVATFTARTPSELLQRLEQIRSTPGVERTDSWLHLNVVKEDYARPGLA